MMNKVKETLRKLLVEMSTATAEDGTVLHYEVLEVGADVTSENGEPVADGTYKIDGTEIVVADGKIQAINKPETPIEEEEDEKTEEKQKCEEETPVEETIVEEPKDEPTEEEPKADEIEELKNQIADLQKQIDDLKEMLKQPASAPVEEQFEKQTPINVKDKKLNDMINRFSCLKK